MYLQKTLSAKIDDIERIHRMVANAEARRHVVLRELAPSRGHGSAAGRSGGAMLSRHTGTQQTRTPTGEVHPKPRLMIGSGATE
jgi:hypothetical protein